MTVTEHIKFWALPFFASVILILMNYSGIAWMQYIISPPINREFGLLENLQLLIILMMFRAAVKASFFKSNGWEKLGFGLLAVFAMLVFLEEVDYGLHYIEYFTNGGVEDKERVRNFHNQGNNNFYVRQAVIGIIVFVFVLLPFVLIRFKNALIQYFAPNRKMALAVVVYLAVGQLARITPKLDVFVVNESLRGNHQEFEELVLYYIFWLYVVQLITRSFPYTWQGLMSKKSS